MKTMARIELGTPVAITNGEVHIPADDGGIVILAATDARRLAYLMLACAEQAAAEAARRAE